MPRILLPNGATREVPILNPGDVLASGAPTALDAGGVDAGEQGPGGIIAPVQNPGVDEDSPTADIPIMMRQTTTPRINTPGVPRTRNTTRPGF